MRYNTICLFMKYIITKYYFCITSPSELLVPDKTCYGKIKYSWNKYKTLTYIHVVQYDINKW